MGDHSLEAQERSAVICLASDERYALYTEEEQTWKQQ